MISYRAILNSRKLQWETLFCLELLQWYKTPGALILLPSPTCPSSLESVPLIEEIPPLLDLSTIHRHQPNSRQGAYLLQTWTTDALCNVMRD